MRLEELLSTRRISLMSDHALATTILDWTKARENYEPVRKVKARAKSKASRKSALDKLLDKMTPEDREKLIAQLESDK